LSHVIGYLSFSHSQSVLLPTQRQPAPPIQSRIADAVRLTRFGWRC